MKALQLRTRLSYFRKFAALANADSRDTQGTGRTILALEGNCQRNEQVEFTGNFHVSGFVCAGSM